MPRTSGGAQAVPAVESLFQILISHEAKFASSFSLVPSENQMSPLARAAMLSDAYGRYFFDEHAVFGRWAFQGGSIVGQIQTDILVPALRELGRAAFVDVHGISGLTGMLLALAAFGKPGSAVFSVPIRVGGHPDTAYVGRRLGYSMREIPFSDWRTVDVLALESLLQGTDAPLIYLDHATSLFAVDIAEVVRVGHDATDGKAHVHVDSSHVNGLIWGNAYPHPLHLGANTYGGSTHKTFPGPHKAVLFTDQEDSHQRLNEVAVNMVSHHHTASVVALAVAALEYLACGGGDYAHATIANARALGAELTARGVEVAAADLGYTSSHQLWIVPPADVDVFEAAQHLFEAGLVVNPVASLPSTGAPGIRIGTNELTRLGVGTEGLAEIAGAFAGILLDREPPASIAPRVRSLREAHEISFAVDTKTADKLVREYLGYLPGFLRGSV